VEEHGAGRQFFRFRSRPHVAKLVLPLGILMAAGAAEAALSGAGLACGALALAAAFVGFHAVRQYGAAMALADSAIRRCQEEHSTAVEGELLPCVQIQRETVERQVLPPMRAQWERVR